MPGVNGNGSPLHKIVAGILGQQVFQRDAKRQALTLGIDRIGGHRPAIKADDSVIGYREMAVATHPDRTVAGSGAAAGTTDAAFGDLIAATGLARWR